MLYNNTNKNILFTCARLAKCVIVFRCVLSPLVFIEKERTATTASHQCRAPLVRLLAARPRLPARVPCIPRALAIPRWLCRVHAAGLSGFAHGRSCGQQWDARSAACARERRYRACYNLVTARLWR